VIANPTQTDTDTDTVGEACDNCRKVANAGQQDTNGNGVGDACVTARVGSWSTGLSHTAGAGQDRLLVFTVGYENNSDPGISSVQYGGQSLTRLNGAVVSQFPVTRLELWYLKEAQIAAAANTTFVVTFVGGASPTTQMYAAATYQNVDQTTPFPANNTNTTATPTPNPLPVSVAVTADGMAVAAAFTGELGTWTWNNGWTEGTDQSFSSASATSADHPAVANGTDNASATHTGPNRQVIVVGALAVAR
jgi:hypothetical protein